MLDKMICMVYYMQSVKENALTGGMHGHAGNDIAV